MPRGDKSKYTDKQKRRAEHIADSYMERGKSEQEAKRRAWATVNAESHGGEKPGGFDGNNDETFNAFDAAKWNSTVQELDQVLREIEQFTEKASDAQLAKAADTLSHVSTHNAYHTGQIMYVRKLQGAWDPSQAVK